MTESEQHSTLTAGVTLSEEEQNVLHWRYTQLQSLGFERDAARVLAESRAELAVVRRLIADGCPVELAFQIVA